MVILEGIWNACIIIGAIILIALFLWALIVVIKAGVKVLIGAVVLVALFLWALVEGMVYLGEAVARR